MTLIFPPRPDKLITAATLPALECAGFVAQPKLNGSNMVLYWTSEHGSVITNRHRIPFAKPPQIQGLSDLFTTPMILNGEWLNKNQAPLNDAFVIFDVIGEDMIGMTFEKRLAFLDRKFGACYSNDPDNYITYLTGNIWRVNTFTSNFKQVYDSLIQVPLVEGLVLKRKNAPLEPGTRESNNSGWQVKIRKPTKNYKA